MKTQKKPMFREISLYLCTFLIGFVSCILLFYMFSISGVEKPIKVSFNNENSAEAPGDWIKLNQIELTENSIIINIDGASLSSYAPTGSMKPLLDEYSNGIRIVPTSPDQIKVGDIVTYGKEKIVHRVIEKGEDEKGVYFITQGDNNEFSDGKIRFEDIKYVTIGILY